MCESPYTLEWNKSDSHCPNLVEKGLSGVPVTIRWSTNFVRKWPSLAHLWSSWYREYIDADDMPRIVVRFEDLLFHTEAVVEEIRDCVGASYVDKEHFHYAAAPAKTHPYFSKYKAPSSLISAMIKYGQDDNGSSRTGNMNEADLAYASKNLDADLIQQFQYQRQPGSNK